MVTESVTGRRSLRRPGRRKRNGTPKAAAPSDARVTIKKNQPCSSGEAPHLAKFCTRIQSRAARSV